MIELPDDELDKLFRKSAEELDPKFEPEDWDNLKKRLDQQDGRTAAAWFKKWWPLGLLLLMIPAGIASYYIFGSKSVSQSYERIQAVSEPNAAESKTNAVEKDVKSAKESEVRTEAADELKSSEPESAAPKNDVTDTKKITGNQLTKKETRIAKTSSESDLKIARNTSKKPLPRSRSKAGGVYLEPNRSKREGGDGALSFNADDRVHKNDPGGTSASELGARQAIGSNGVTPDEAKMHFDAKNLVNRPLSWVDKIPYPAITADSVQIVTENTPAEQVDNPVVESPKWAIRLGYSPDLTTVGFKNFTKPGTAFSLLVEYGMTKRLYLQTGVVRTEKDYYAPGREYQFKYYVTSVNTPDSLDGVCIMYEIPLGFRYDLIQKVNSRFFVGAGASSYYIQNEKYTYYYKDYKHGQKPGWEGKSGLTLFSHLNASFGYERTITRKLSILAEPYIRVPLKGVGYGKVNLTTVGMWLSLRYTPAFR